MKQRITWTSFLEVDTDGLNWEEATRLAKQQMSQTSEAYLGKVIRMEIVEEDE
jgi:hypothetical protein